MTHCLGVLAGLAYLSLGYVVLNTPLFWWLRVPLNGASQATKAWYALGKYSVLTLWPLWVILWLVAMIVGAVITLTRFIVRA